jgi:trehalose 6-phosphate synthase/phosphatase
LGIVNLGLVLFVGNGKPDEVVFSYLREIPGAVTCTVGKKQSEAKTYLPSVSDAVTLLEELGNI